MFRNGFYNYSLISLPFVAMRDAEGSLIDILEAALQMGDLRIEPARVN